MQTSLIRLCVTASLLAISVGITGCDSGPKLVPIEGQVTLDGKPLAFGQIQIIPKDGRPAYSELDSQGHFKLWTDEKEGCAKGTHIVVVNSKEFINDNLTKRYAPEKYDSGITSDANLTVDAPTKDAVIALKSDGKAYPLNTR